MITRKHIYNFLTCLALCMLWGTKVHCEQIIRLTPSEDTYCVNNATIHGLEPTMVIAHSSYGEWQRVAYLKFDISTVPTEIDSLVVRMYTNGWKVGDTKEHQLKLFPVQRNDWAEDDLSYQNYSTKLGSRMDSPLLASCTPVAQGAAFGPGWLEWRGSNLQKYVLDSAQAAKQYISFRLRETNIVKTSGNETSLVQIHSKENESGFAPELIVYAPDGAQPAKRDTLPVVHDSTEARLSAILLDGEEMEFFDKDQFIYNVNLPYTTTQDPVLTPILLDTVATAVVNGNTIITTSADGEHTQTYTVNFNILPKMDLFLAIGQSNMAGRAPYDDATEEMDGVYLATPQAGMEISTNPMNQYSNVRKDISVQGMGPHYQFALNMRDSLPHHTIGMVVNAQGGTSITVWYKPGKTNYDKTIERAKKASKWGEWKGVIWHQGESDVTNGASDNYATYKDRLATLANSLRTDLGVDTLWFIVGELSQKETQAAFNQTVIQSVASYIPYSDYVVSTGTALLSDNIHFDEASVKLLGQRYAEKVLQHAYRSNNAPSQLNNIEENNVYCKYILNNQFIILRNGVNYDALGKRIY